MNCGSRFRSRVARREWCALRRADGPVRHRTHRGRLRWRMVGWTEESASGAGGATSQLTDPATPAIWSATARARPCLQREHIQRLVVAPKPSSMMPAGNRIGKQCGVYRDRFRGLWPLQRRVTSHELHVARRGGPVRFHRGGASFQLGTISRPGSAASTPFGKGLRKTPKIAPAAT